MNLHGRKIDPEQDRDTLLALHCASNYASDCSWARRISYQQYEREWLATSQPESFLSDMRASQKDPRTIAEFWCDPGGKIIGYVWVTFSDIEGYGLVIAEVRDIVVVSECRRKGLGTEMLSTVEAVARERGADLLRGDIGYQNTPSRLISKKVGCTPYRICVEKPLSPKCR